MAHRTFSVGDRAVEHNLERLDHLSRQDYPMEEQLLDDLVVAVIESYELLPETYKKVIRLSSCYTHGTHWGTTQDRRDAIWARVRSELNAGLDVVHSQQENLALGCADPPQTKGERILALIEEFRAQGPDVRTARQLILEGAGTDVATDARKLVKLLDKKRISNGDAHYLELGRLIMHIEIVARRLHHFK